MVNKDSEINQPNNKIHQPPPFSINSTAEKLRDAKGVMKIANAKHCGNVIANYIGIKDDNITS